MHDQEMESEPRKEQANKETDEARDKSLNVDKESMENNRNSQEGRDGDALAWIEGPAFNSPIEELPTLQWPEKPPENNTIDESPLEDIDDPSPDQVIENDKQTTEQLNNLEDAMLWLEQLAAGQGTPINEMPTLISSGQYDDLDIGGNAFGQDLIEITGKTSTLAEHDSDPMAWLEQLAVDQNSPLEELPSVADRLLASEIISQNEGELAGILPSTKTDTMAIEVEEALNYLEQLAVSEGIDLDQIKIDHLELGNGQEDSLNNIDQLAIAASTKKVLDEAGSKRTKETSSDDWNELTAQIPDDPDEALAWLGGLADEEPTAEGGGELAKDDVPGSVNTLGTEEPALDPGTLDEMPDDPDEAMAWMRGLAEQQENVTDHQGDYGNDDKNLAGESVDELAADGGSRLNNEAITEARNAVSSGNLDKAAKIYQELLDSDSGGSELISALESVVDEHPKSPELLKLLGDAYMQDGQMQKALATYRKGFDHL